MKIIHFIIDFFAQFEPHYAIGLTIKTVGILVAAFFLQKFRPRWRHGAYAVLCVLLLRLALFECPYSWNTYFTTLETDDVGWRQQSALGVEYYKYFKITKPKKYLAVGSSQSYVIYMPYSKENSQLIVFNLAGMTPLDMFFYRDYIVQRRPEYILLYLSEFDIAKVPNLDAVKIGPNQGFGLIKELPALFAILKLGPPSIALNEIIVGELIPEYKYSFIFRGYLDHWTHKKQALHVKSMLDELSPDAQQLALSNSDLVKELDAKWVPYNIYFLEKFLDFCRIYGIKVVIAEGQYNPGAYTKKTLELNRITREELERIDQRFDNVTFFPRSQTLQFTAQDYLDYVHVRSDAGLRYAQDLIHKIEMTENVKNNPS